MALLNAEGYQAKVNTLDEDSYTDNFGILHRTVIQKIPIVQAVTQELTEAELSGIMSNLRAQYTNDQERKATVTAWIPEYGAYVTQGMYLSDPEITIKEVKDGKLIYKPLTLKFNGYGE